MAYQDPAYKIQSRLLPANESMRWNIAKIYDVKIIRYPAEGAPYKYPDLIKLGLQAIP